MGEVSCCDVLRYGDVCCRDEDGNMGKSEGRVA